MADSTNLSDRIDAQFAALGDKIKKAQQEEVENYKARQKRLEKFAQVVEELRNVWEPRLDTLMKKFGEQIKVTPQFTQAGREARFTFDSNLAHVVLKLAASADRDVRNLVVSYDLEIVPILMKFDRHAEIEFPLEAVDRAALGKWLDDRIVGFVQTYLALHENEYYLKDYMVEDPVVKMRFPKFAAGATLQKDGKMLYFINEETRKEYEKKSASK
jgi:YHS domain-containing protein